MTKITTDEVRKLADLIRIAVTDDDVADYSDAVSEMLTYAHKLSELNTDDVPVTTHGTHVVDVMRADTPGESLTQADVLKNAPEKQDGHFKVPSIMD